MSKKPRNLDGTLSKRKRDQDAPEALTHLREVGLVPWSRISVVRRGFQRRPVVTRFSCGVLEHQLDMQ